MSSRLPEFIDPWHFAEIGKEISGQVRFTDLPRLKGILVDQGGEAEFSLRFHKGDKQRVHISGYVKATPTLECQRCLEPVGCPIVSEFDVTVVEGYEEAKLLPDEQEPLVAGDKRIRLTEVVEDELLLALPQVPMHPLDQCKTIHVSTNRSLAEADGKSSDDKVNPFAVLEDLKTEQN